MDARWHSETGLMLDSNYQHWELGSDLDHLDIWENLNQTLSSESYSFNPPDSGNTSNTYSGGSSIDSSNAGGGAAVGVQRERKMMKTSSPSILSFGNPESESLNDGELYQNMMAISAVNYANGLKSVKRSYDAMVVDQMEKKAGGASPRTLSHNQDHILAERKRREKLSQKFIALSAIVPGLKKMDKASVLGDAIKYLKTLQEKVNALEEQAAKRTVESAVLVKKSHLVSEDDNEVSYSDENFGLSQSPLPEIEVKLSNKSLLIKIHCENRKGMLVRCLADIEKLHISVVSASALPFAASSIDITVTAQIEEGFSMSVKDVVRKLSSSFKAVHPNKA